MTKEMSKMCCGNFKQEIIDGTKNGFVKDFKNAPESSMPNTRASRLTKREISPFRTQRQSPFEVMSSRDSGREKSKVIFQCHHEEHKKKADMKRRKLIRKIKKNYDISVDNFDEHVTNEIIRKVESIERENREREKKHLERTMYIVKKLLEEQKSKKKSAIAFAPRKSRVRVKTILPCLSEVSKSDETKTEMELPETALQNLRLESPKLKSPCGTRSKSQEKMPEPLNEENDSEKDELLQENGFSSACHPSLTTLKSTPPLEKCLEASPKRIVFQDYKSGQVYLQPLKITNISLETIHCRYLGIVVHCKQKGRFPVAVAVRDSVKLRPGLSCSTKIRLSSKDDTKEIECSIAYETRRQRKPSKHSFFFVPVVCLPARAIIRINPLKIRFPCLTWCAATCMESNKVLVKTIEIENSGGKECYCQIRKKSVEDYEGEEEVFGEEEESFLEKTEQARESKSRMSDVTKCKTDEETDKEDSTLCEGDISDQTWKLEMADDFLIELLDNVFATFRFSEKYYIVVPPFSTKRINVRFIPEYKGFHQESHVLLFEDCHNYSEAVLELTGDIKKLPFVAEPKLIDLKTCVINSGAYAANFNVSNTSKAPQSIRLKLPRALKNHACVHPKGTILHPNSSYKFSVRVYPRLTLSRDAGRYYNEDSGVLEFPIFIHSASSTFACKSDSIKIFVFAIITDYSLEIYPSVIDFGHVSTLETVRTAITLTNHSLVIQDFAFLNLPKGVRVEPNMGFGNIFPMETITLFLLYSPGVDVVRGSRNKSGKHSFAIKVTTVAEYGGFGEKLEERLTSQSLESIPGEYLEVGNSENTFYPKESKPVTPEEFEKEDIDTFNEYGECYSSDSELENEMHEAKKADEEAKIRTYLKLDSDDLSEHSFFKRINLKGSSVVKPSEGNVPKETSVNEREDEDEMPCTGFSGRIPKPPMNSIRCEAVVTEPLCQLSDSIIQLPATPCSSFSLYRFRLKGSNECLTPNCTCFMRKNHEEPERFEAAFEFKYCCPHFKLEPQSGFFKSGETVPITVIFRPEFPAEDLCREARDQKAKKLAAENSVKETPAVSRTKGKKSTGQSKRNSVDVNINEIIDASLYELEKYDLFAGERSLQELISPFHIEAKITCLVRINMEDGSVKTEIHNLVLICPAVKPSFVYKGTSQEIDFDKVFVGTKARALIEIQNISFERICPAMSLLNPVGPFLCPSSLRNVPVDPEHVLRQPLTYCPSKNGGVEKEYFEIHCGSTNISLLAKGEAVVPAYKITPNYGFYILESKIGSAEELRLDIENLNPMKFRLCFVVNYAKEGLDVGYDSIRPSDSLKENAAAVSTDKKKKTESEKKYQIGWEEAPEAIVNELKKFDDMSLEDQLEIFNLTGVDSNSEVVIYPHGKSTVKIKFTPPPIKYDKGEASPLKKYAVNYRILLQQSAILKEILVVGIIPRAK